MQRRNLFRLAAAGCAALSVPTLRAAQSKSIVIIYSRTGSTEQLARWIAEETKSDYLKLELVEPYAESYGAMTNIAREERASGKRREIKTTIPDLAAYDTIWLGSPYWWGGYSVPMLTFLKDNPLEGKRVLPFCTSAPGRTSESSLRRRRSKRVSGCRAATSAPRAKNSSPG